MTQEGTLDGMSCRSTELPVTGVTTQIMHVLLRVRHVPGARNMPWSDEDTSPGFQEDQEWEWTWEMGNRTQGGVFQR